MLMFKVEGLCHTAEIFAVGNHVATIGSVAVLPSCLLVVAPEQLGSVDIDGSEAHITIQTKWEENVPGAAKQEALRMSCRVVQKRWPNAAIDVIVDEGQDWAEALRADGFKRVTGDLLSRSSGPFALVGRKSDLTYNVYDSVLDVPWNYVPAETEAYQELLDGPPRRVLDIGAGVGKNARVLARAGHEVTSVDASAWAVGRMKNLMPSVNSAVASATSLPFEYGAFDVVLDIGCLHCVPNNDRVLVVKEIARVLASGGLIISRIFKPRSEEWILRQPFQADTFGMSETEVFELFEPSFSRPEWTRTDPNMHYLRAWSKA